MKKQAQTQPGLSALAAAILARDDGAFVDVECPEWECTIRISSMTLAEKAAWSTHQEKDPALATARLVCHTARGKDGAMLFPLEVAPDLAQKSSVVMDRLALAAFKVNKLRVEDREAEVKN